MSEAHKTLIRRFMEEIHNKGNLDAVEEFIHPQHIRHTNQTFGGGRDFHGPEGFRQAVAAWRRAFSEVHFRTGASGFGLARSSGWPWPTPSGPRAHTPRRRPVRAVSGRARFSPSVSGR